MVEPVQGFIADDGTFFKTKELCEAHEAQRELRLALSQLGMKDPDRAFSLINKCSHLIWRYLVAMSALPVVDNQEDEPDTEENDDDEGELGGIEIGAGDGESEDDNNFSEGDIGDAEEDAETVQLLPPGVHKPMPDLGRHIQPTKIRHERKINGPRGGQSNARNLRDSEDMATPPRRPPPKTRRGNR